MSTDPRDAFAGTFGSTNIPATGMATPFRQTLGPGSYVFIANLRALSGGSNDATIVDPHTGARLWCPDAVKVDGETRAASLGELLRRLADAADHHRFMDPPQD